MMPIVHTVETLMSLTALAAPPTVVLQHAETRLGKEQITNSLTRCYLFLKGLRSVRVQCTAQVLYAAFVSSESRARTCAWLWWRVHRTADFLLLCGMPACFAIT